MNKEIKLIIPALEQKEKVLEFKAEFFAHGEKSINGSELLDYIDSYEEWLQGITNNKSIDTVDINWVVTDTFLAMREEDNKIIGIIDLRHSLNDFLKDCGHIGYSVRPTERNKGYATAMLKEVVQIAKRANMMTLQLSCTKANVPSYKTIVKNGGVYEREFKYQGEVASVFRISTMITTPVLITNRLMLRPLKVTDADTVFKGWASKEKVAKYMRWNLHSSIEDTKEWLREEETNIDSLELFNWGFLLKETNELIGSGGLVFKEERQEYEIGYNLNDEFWGRGYATEAGKAIVEYAFHTLNTNSIFAVYAKENMASKKVLEKLGFSYTKDGIYSSYDGKRSFQARELLLINADGCIGRGTTRLVTEFLYTEIKRR